MQKEKETVIRMTKTEDEAHIFTEMRAFITPLLDHEHFEEDRRREHEGAVVAVGGTIPISCITVKGKPRKDDNQLSSVVSR